MDPFAGSMQPEDKSDGKESFGLGVDSFFENSFYKMMQEKELAKMEKCESGNYSAQVEESKEVLEDEQGGSLMHDTQRFSILDNSEHDYFISDRPYEESVALRKHSLYSDESK